MSKDRLFLLQPPSRIPAGGRSVFCPHRTRSRACSRAIRSRRDDRGPAPGLLAEGAGGGTPRRGKPVAAGPRARCARPGAGPRRGGERPPPLRADTRRILEVLAEVTASGASLSAATRRDHPGSSLTAGRPATRERFVMVRGVRFRVVAVGARRPAGLGAAAQGAGQAPQGRGLRRSLRRRPAGGPRGSPTRGPQGRDHRVQRLEPANARSMPATSTQQLPAPLLLANQVKARGYRIVALDESLLVPAGIHSAKYARVADIPDRSRNRDPERPTNAGPGAAPVPEGGPAHAAARRGLDASLRDVAANRGAADRRARRGAARPLPRRRRGRFVSATTPTWPASDLNKALVAETADAEAKPYFTWSSARRSRTARTIPASAASSRSTRSQPVKDAIRRASRAPSWPRV